MGALNIENVKKSFGAVDILKGINLDVKDGEFVVFVGPSGRGKSTLLRIIAGLDDTSSGLVRIDGQAVNDVPPAKRGIAMVFQSYALYPHLSVRNNMGLGLKQAGTPAQQVEERVKAASAMLALDPYLDRRPAELSGGQRQRVAIGRAVVREPKLILFDEPLSNLDAALRVNTRIEIAQLHQRLRATMIYVTHDQVEAMTLADKIVVLNGGHIEQVGAPMQLYNDPDNTFVAGFIGSPKMNFIDGARVGETAETIGVRPEHISVGRDSGAWKANVSYAEHLGADTYLYLDSEKVGAITVRLAGEYRVQPGDIVYAEPDKERVLRFDESGKRLRP